MTAEQVHAMGFRLPGETKSGEKIIWPCYGCGVMNCEPEKYYRCSKLVNGEWFPEYKPNVAFHDLYVKVMGIEEPPKVETEAGVQYLLFEM